MLTTLVTNLIWHLMSEHGVIPSGTITELIAYHKKLDKEAQKCSTT